MPAHLFTLPRELSDQVLSRLSVADIGSLRLVNKEFNDAIAPDFAGRHLSYIDTDLSRHSLQRLDRLADSELVQKNAIVLDICCQGRLGRPPGHGFEWSDVSLLHPAADLLNSILANKLTGCKCLQVRCLYGDRCRLFSEKSLCSQKIGWVLCLLAERAIRVQELELEMPEESSPDMTFLRSWELTKRSSFQRCCKDLRRIQVAFCLREDNVPMLVSLMGHAEKLNDLKISNDQAGRTPTYYPLVDLLTRLSLQGTLHWLRSLHLFVGHSSGSYDDISFRRWRFWLADMSQLEYLSIFEATMGLDGHWADLLATIPSTSPGLKRIVLQNLRQEIAGKVRVALNFPELASLAKSKRARRFFGDEHQYVHVVGPRDGDLAFRLSTWKGCHNPRSVVTGVEYFADKVMEAMEYLSVRENLLRC